MNFSSVGHTIQRMINNTPIAITANDTTTEVVTNGGNLYQTGLINGKIHTCFDEIFQNENIVGQIVDAEAVDNKVYILNNTGSVFEVDYNYSDCGPVVREVYSPVACGGDKAVRIDTGRAHVLILTENHKVYGAGNNQAYQLVPQGQCEYSTAVEILITDTNLHDNDSCSAFTGVFNELTCPVIPQCEVKHNNIECIKETRCDVLLGYFTIADVTLTPPAQPGTLSIPVYGDISYVGFLCVDSEGCVSGNVTYTISRLVIHCGQLPAKFTTSDSVGCHVREFYVASTSQVILFEADPCRTSNPCNVPSVAPITGVSQIQGKCGSCVDLNMENPMINIPLVVTYVPASSSVNIALETQLTSISALCDVQITAFPTAPILGGGFALSVQLGPCHQPVCRPQPELKQPCWSNIYAGGDNSVLVDSCNRIYVLGSLHTIRSNRDLLKRSCLEDLLNNAGASISFPADQLNCAKRPHNNNKCDSTEYPGEPFRTDLNKFGVHLNLPAVDECGGRSMNVCDFLKALQHCNDARSCSPTCEPCDGYVYLNVFGECGCPYGAPTSSPIGSVTVYNKKSVCKLVSQSCADTYCISATTNTIVEYDINKYCVDNTDIPLDRILKLNFCNDGPNVNIYVDVDIPGGIKFISEGRQCNVEFTVNASTKNQQFILNHGTILDPAELSNLKYALCLDAYYPCAKYKNPFNTKLINTYLRGGDRVKFIVTNPKNVRLAVTADVPTVFRLNRKVLDVAVGTNNLSVLVGGLACPNDIFAIGSNCHGELGIGSRETVLCWKELNRCGFDCQVTNLFAGANVTFYATQSNTIYGSGSWKNLVESDVPVVVESICRKWRIRQMAITKSHIILLGSDGFIFGVGDNSMGELGLGNTDYVKKPIPLVFFNKLNNNAARQLRENLDHPVEAKCKKFRPFNQCGPCQPFNACAYAGPCAGPYNNNDCQPNQYDCNGPNKYPKNKKYNANGRLYPNQYRY